MSFVTRIAVALLVATLSLTGCSTNDAGQADNRMAQLTDVPLPAGYDIDHSNTFILGEGDRWSGKLSYSINSSADDMFNFIRAQMPTLGWHEVSVYRAPVSVMTFVRGNRVATVRISRGVLYGSNIEMVVAPKTGSQVSTSSPRGDLRADEMQPPPPAAGPNRDVSVTPIH